MQCIKQHSATGGRIKDLSDARLCSGCAEVGNAEKSDIWKIHHCRSSQAVWAS